VKKLKMAKTEKKKAEGAPAPVFVAHAVVAKTTRHRVSVKTPPPPVSASLDGGGEIGGPKGLEPTRFGDWERKGRCIDF
jgi:hypothetical protein